VCDTIGRRKLGNLSEEDRRDTSLNLRPKRIRREVPLPLVPLMAHAPWWEGAHVPSGRYGALWQWMQSSWMPPQHMPTAQHM